MMASNVDKDDTKIKENQKIPNLQPRQGSQIFLVSFNMPWRQK
jgi:hypothetical protein